MSALRNDIVALLPALARYARALTGERAAGEDLVQDCLIRALGAEAQWRGGSIKSWVFTIMTNLNRNRLRARASMPVYGSEEIEAIEAAVTEPALRIDIDRALASLSVEHREVLLMVGLEGLSYEETARALGVPLGTVMSRLSRARDAFRRALEGRAEAPALRRVK